MKLNYDLHIHSCLSPCGDDEMTPYNLVNMAKICGCDIIALTDHNSCLNCESAIKAGKEAGITVVPGMELCTAEEIHCICLFPDLESALGFSRFVETKLLPVKNKEKIFGRQLVMDEKDAIISSFEILLTTAADISIEELPTLMEKYGGIFYPAHIDRSSYSIIASLGDFPPDLQTDCFELTYKADEQRFRESFPATVQKNLIRSSDAHCLEQLMTEKLTVDLEENSAAALVDAIKQKKDCFGK